MANLNAMVNHCLRETPLSRVIATFTAHFVASANHYMYANFCAHHSETAMSQITVGFIVAALAFASSCRVVYAQADAPVHECDRLASSNFAPFPGVAPVAMGKIQTAEAIVACRQALIAYPNTVRFQFQIGRAYQQATKYSWAVFWYEKAIEGGSALAANNLAGIYYDGRGSTPPRPDLVEARRLFELSARGSVDLAMMSLALMLFDGEGGPKDAAGALDWFKKAAATGNVDAMVRAANMLDRGVEVPRDVEAAKKLYSNAAIAKNPYAAYKMGRYHYIEFDYPSARSWYEIAALLNSPEAMVDLGIMAYKGEGQDKDAGAAFKWYEKAVQVDSPEGAFNLAQLYDRGEGVQPDLVFAATLLYDNIKRSHQATIDWIVEDPGIFQLETRRWLQRLLAGDGFYRGSQDGIIGLGTVKAIAAAANMDAGQLLAKMPTIAKKRPVQKSAKKLPRKTNRVRTPRASSEEEWCYDGLYGWVDCDEFE